MVQGAITLEVQHGVDDVLERLWPGDAAAFRDVTDHDHRRPRFLREPHEARGALAHLPDVARCTLEVSREHGLYGIDDHDTRLAIAGGSEHRLEQSLAQKLHLSGTITQAICTKLDLQRRFLTGDVER
jgi:hypothetical protein